MEKTNAVKPENVYEIFIYRLDKDGRKLTAGQSAGLFSTYESALKGINWIRERCPDYEGFVRTRILDAINGRYAFMELNISEAFKGDLIQDIKIF